MAKEVKSALASLTGLSFGDKHKGDKDKEKAEKDAAEKDKADKAAQFASMKDSDVTKSRRRLSVVAATGAKQHTLDGVGEGAPNERGESTPGLKCFDKFSLYSHVGFVPFNTAKVNQDRGVAVAPYCKTDEKAFFGVFDGHGALGHEVSSYVQKNLCEEIAKQPNLESDPEAALTKGFVDCNTKLAKGSVDCTFSGTTVIVCYINGKTLYSANAGDSRAVLARNEDGKMVAVPLSSDQKPEREDEAKRIKANQGRVEACKGPRGEEIGPQRVWLLHQDVPGLAMTRSFGDLIAASVGVIPTPEVWKRTLDSKDKFMILASDGVWEFISSQEAVDIVAKCKDGEEACKALWEESTRRWRAEEEVVDDITCLIVYFNSEA